MKKHQRTEGKSDEYLTPMSIIRRLGVFDVDPCCCEKAFRNGYYEDHIVSAYWKDGLELRFLPTDRVWMNPPFNRYIRPMWMEKMALHNRGTLLVPAACETDAFYQSVWGRASGILFLKGRPHFYSAEGVRYKANSGCTICLISYGEYDLRMLQSSGLGHVIDLTLCKNTKA